MQKRIRLTFGIFMLFVLTSALPAQKPLVQNELYPTQLGTRWVYLTKAGKEVARFESRIVGYEMVGDVKCAKIESATIVKNNVRTRIQTELVHVSDKGVFRYAANKNNLTPPLQFLAFPAKKGASWEIATRSLGLELKGTFKIEEVEITVPAGKYKTIVCRSLDFTVDGKNIPHTYYFAAGVGLIKQEVEFGGQKVVLELEKFEAGK